MIPRSWRLKWGFWIAPQGYWTPNLWNEARQKLSFWLTRP